MAIVTYRNKKMLVGASYFSDDSFVTTSMVYLWDNTLNLFNEYYSISGTEGPHDVEAIHNDRTCGFFLSNDRNAKKERVHLLNRTYLRIAMLGLRLPSE